MSQILFPESKELKDLSVLVQVTQALPPKLCAYNYGSFVKDPAENELKTGARVEKLRYSDTIVQKYIKIRATKRLFLLTQSCISELRQCNMVSFDL